MDMINNRKKKRAVTLIEIMIVILLIGLISGALAFNMRGSMDKGRVFKSQQNAIRVYDILMMESAKGELDLEQIVQNKEQILNKSPLVKNGASLLKDGWGKSLEITINGDDLEIFSAKAREWENAHQVKPQ
jgi:prepilin-type N-terminal cleavage/methylation domain-containing protein